MRPYLVGLVGAGVRPSLTPALHMREAAEHGLSYVYRTIDIAELGLEPGDIGELLRHAQLLGYDALNVTHPCKQLVLEHLDRLDPVAARIGAVNTVVFEGGARGEIVGFNTDTTGFASALRTALPGASTRQVLQLGAGGAGAAVADALLSRGAGRLVIVDLDVERASALAHHLTTRFPEASIEGADCDKLPALVPLSDGLVNCTPVGMADHPGTPLDPGLLGPDLWVADIVYRPLDTPLLGAARRAGCPTLHGGHMAVYQAADAFRLITGVNADAGRMLAHLRQLADSDR